MDTITKEYHSSVKMNLQNKNNLSTSEHFRGYYPCRFFIHWVYAIVFVAIILMLTNAFYSRKEDFFTPKGMSNLR